MRVSAINSHRVSFGERGGFGDITRPGTFKSLIDGSGQPVESMAWHNYEYLRLQKIARTAEDNVAKFSHEDVIAIAHLRTLPERLAKIADIMQLKKLIKM